MLERFKISVPRDGVSGRTITIPLNMQFNSMDNSELAENWASSEAKKTINEDTDRETIRYFGELNLTFNFYESNNETYNKSYLSAGFNEDDIIKKSNRFKNSYYRLYFYDESDEQTRSLLFTEDITPQEAESNTNFVLNRLFWLKNDTTLSSGGTRDVYLTTSFFNRATGDVKNFLNSPTRTSPYTIGEYSGNIGWRTIKITLEKSGDDYSFSVGNNIELFETIVK